MGRRCGCRFASPFCLCWQEGMDYFIEASTLLRYLRAHEWDVDKATATSGPNDRTLLIPLKEVLIMSDTCNGQRPCVFPARVSSHGSYIQTICML